MVAAKKSNCFALRQIEIKKKKKKKKLLNRCKLIFDFIVMSLGSVTAAPQNEDKEQVQLC